MNYWAKKVKNILIDSKVSVRLLRKYVDDVRWVITKITRGLKFEPGEGMLVYDPGNQINI